MMMIMLMSTEMLMMRRSRALTRLPMTCSLLREALCHWNKATCLQKGWVYTQRTINVKLLMVLSVNQVMLMTDGFLMNRTRIISIAQNKNIDKSINVHVAIWQNVFIETTNENEKISNEKQKKTLWWAQNINTIKFKKKLVVGTKI